MSSSELHREGLLDQPGEGADHGVAGDDKLPIGMVVIMRVFALVAALVSLLASCGRPSVDSASLFLDAVRADAGLSPAPGFYRYVVIADAYMLCAELAAGTQPVALVRSAVRDGINGNLYPAEAVLAMVDQAPRYLCPAAVTPGA
ncbi:DUF732 domain-containing protein [Amycolatopsis thermoflava]|uniref:DUF732 domain-containing protein n=1 Tax=Amycolatopsis thermoflava TaxID=84480 RepID=UPI00365EAB27